MIDMLLFWLVYGVWMVLSWTTIVSALVMATSLVLEWITDDDYNIRGYADWFNDLSFNTLSTGIPLGFGACFTLSYAVCYTIITLVKTEDMATFHEVAVIIAEWMSTTMQTPLLITLTITGIILLMKKAYPIFKKVKMLTDKL